MSKKKKKPKAKKPRNYDALNAILRKASKFKHKTEPRGGDKRKGYQEED